jgi:hypothetical protein
MANTTYYIYLISGYGGANPSCMASASLTPSFLHTSGYSLALMGNTTSGSPVIFNVGGPFPGGLSKPMGNPLAGAAINDTVTGSTVPSSATISSLASFYLSSVTGTWSSTSANQITSISTPLTNVAAYMLVGPPANSPSGNFTFPTGNTTIENVCTSACSYCSPAPCILLYNSITCTCSSGSTGTVAISGNFTITLGPYTTASSTAQGAMFNVYDGYYRMVGALNTNATHSRASECPASARPLAKSHFAA